MNARARAGLVRKTPADTWPYAPCAPFIRREFGEGCTDTAEETRKTYPRIKVGGRHPNACGGSGHSPVGLTHVGATLEQRGPVAHWDESVDVRRGDTGFRIGRGLRGSATKQGRKLKQGRLSLTFQGRNARAHLCDQALRSHHIELRVSAGFMTLHSNIGFVAHHCKRMAGHGNLLSHRADLCVGACSLGSNRDFDRIARCGVGLGIRARGLDRPTDVAEQVHLVGDIDVYKRQEWGRLIYIVAAVYAIFAFGEMIPLVLNYYTFMFFTVAGLALAAPNPNPPLWLLMEAAGGGLLIGATIVAARTIGAPSTAEPPH